MDSQTIYNIFASIIIAIIGWLGKTLWDAVKELKEDVKQIEIALPEKYVTKQDIEKRFDSIDNQFRDVNKILQRIFDKLEHKADKGGCQ